jgi:competence protein ComEC
LKLWALLIMGAVLPFLFDTVLPSDTALLLLLLLAVAAFRPACRIYCILPLFFLTTTLAINQRITQRLPLADSRSVHVISGAIASLPQSRGNVVRFLFLPDDPVAPVPSRIRVSWYEHRSAQGNPGTAVPRLRAGERWQLHLQLRSPRAKVNFHGLDAERWYFTDGIGALGYVQDGNNIRLAGPGIWDLQHWRESVLDKLAGKAGDAPAFRILAALAIADRRGLLNSDRIILSATGTGHLLAISGLHIGLAAAMGFFLGRLSLLLVSHRLRQRVAVVLPWLSAWLAAFAYAALSGFGVSTQRALIMLTVATVVMLGRRNVHPVLAWLVAMALVLVADPFAPLRAGFWFSFIAVAVLMMLFAPRFGPMPAWRRMLMAQLGISLVMAPLGMYWFQQASLPGLLANLVAIPVVSMLVVPLILIALLVLWLPGPLAGWLLTIAGYVAHWLFLFLDFMSGLQPSVFGATRTPGLAATILAMLGAAAVMLPRGVRLRYAGLLLMLPMMLPSGSTVGRAETQIDFLDVGQGLAILLAAHDFLMLYDTGPGNGLVGEEGWNLVSGTIQPMVKATGRSPDLIVASHADLDHAGGLPRLQAVYPEARFLASLPEQQPRIHSCTAPSAWETENLEFRVLHPSIGLPYLGNNSSCVISGRGPGFSFLLGGDIDRAVEQRLVDEGLGQHDILIAPHHGSSASSSQVLINTVHPKLALVSAGANNRFGFPRQEVLNRYAFAGVPTLNTAHCGGIRITADGAGGFEVESARAVRKAIWRWPAGANCRMDE